MIDIIRYQIIMYVIMVIVGICFNAMNALAYRISDIYLSTTLFYAGLLMASNMMWAHELVHYFAMGHFNIVVFLVGITLSVFITFALLRNQWQVDEQQWLRRMISHHSTAITTTKKLLKRTEIMKDNVKLQRLAKDIVDTQEREIELMKSMIQ